MFYQNVHKKKRNITWECGNFLLILQIGRFYLQKKGENKELSEQIKGKVASHLFLTITKEITDKFAVVVLYQHNQIYGKPIKSGICSRIARSSIASPNGSTGGFDCFYFQMLVHVEWFIIPLKHSASATRNKTYTKRAYWSRRF